MRKRQGPTRVRRTYAIREDLAEVLEELSDELTVGRNVILEAALTAYFERLELPLRNDGLPPDETNDAGP